MIELDQLEFAYKKKSKIPFKQIKEPVLTGANWKLAPGKICGLLGSNGAGKTTLIKMMSGLLFPDAGTLLVHGQHPQNRTESFLADTYYLAEEFFLPNISPRTYSKRYGVFYPRFDEAMYFSLLEEFQLNPDKSLKDLSHGQKKKAMLSFGLSTNARLLLLDEPSNGLDIPSKRQFRNVLLKSFDEERSIVISTHQVQDLDGLIDSVSILSGGRILLAQTLEDISAKLCFNSETARPENIIYEEQNVGGNASVSINNDRLETQVDLSLLFGLVTSDPQKIQNIFPQGGAI